MEVRNTICSYSKFTYHCIRIVRPCHALRYLDYRAIVEVNVWHDYGVEYANRFF